MRDGRGSAGDSERRGQCRRGLWSWNGSGSRRGRPWEGPRGHGDDWRGVGGGGSRGHRVVGGRGDGLEPKGGGGGGRAWGRSIAIGSGKKPVGGCYSAKMRRPAIRSTAHDPILSSLNVNVTVEMGFANCTVSARCLHGHTALVVRWPHRTNVALHKLIKTDDF